MNPLYTIGYSSRSQIEFIDLLRQNGVNALADVRSFPFSRRYPHFSRDQLRATLSQAGIHYVFLGKELGARSDDPACYRNGKADYKLISRTEQFHKGLDRIREGLRTGYRIALMCAEREPLECHRAILVCKPLRSDLQIFHIIGQGQVETHRDMETRLLSLLRLEPDFLKGTDPKNILEEAYELQGERIAYSGATIDSTITRASEVS